MNRAQIIGNLTRDPEHKTTGSGQVVTNFSVATNRRWKDEKGEDKELTDFHNCVAWAGLAERVATLGKGQRVFVEGRLTTRSWDDPNGVKKYKTEIVAYMVNPFMKSEAPAEPKTDPKEALEAEEGKEDEPSF